MQSEDEKAPAHDAFTSLLHRLEPDAATLWRKASGQVSLRQGILVIDDATLDEPSARKMELVVRHVNPDCKGVRAMFGNTSRKAAPEVELTESDIQRAMARLNNRPRQRLNYRTPQQVFFQRTEYCTYN